jgi:hypothetical protein
MEDDGMTEVGRVSVVVVLGLLVMGLASCGEDAPQPDGPGVEEPPAVADTPRIDALQRRNPIAEAYGIPYWHWRVTLPEVCWMTARFDLWTRGKEEPEVLSEVQALVPPSGLLTFTWPPPWIEELRDRLGSDTHQNSYGETVHDGLTQLRIDGNLTEANLRPFDMSGAADLPKAGWVQNGSCPFEMRADVAILAQALWRDFEEVRPTIHVPALWQGQRDPNSVYAHEGVAVGTNMKKSNPDYVLVLVLRFWPAGDDPEQSREEK